MRWRWWCSSSSHRRRRSVTLFFDPAHKQWSPATTSPSIFPSEFSLFARIHYSVGLAFACSLLFRVLLFTCLVLLFTFLHSACPSCPAPRLENQSKQKPSEKRRLFFFARALSSCRPLIYSSLSLSLFKPGMFQILQRRLEFYHAKKEEKTLCLKLAPFLSAA